LPSDPKYWTDDDSGKLRKAGTPRGPAASSGWSHGAFSADPAAVDKKNEKERAKQAKYQIPSGYKAQLVRLGHSFDGGANAPEAIGDEAPLTGGEQDSMMPQNVPAGFERAILFDWTNQTYQLEYTITRLDYEVARSKFAQRPLAVMIISIDNLENIRIEYGPEAVDLTFSNVALNLVQSSRPIDIIGSYNEGRFLAVCPEILGEQVIRLAEHFRQVCSAIELNLGWQYHFNTSISIGIAVYGTDLADVESLIAIADLGADTAVSRGGNTICFGVDSL
jgi:diguanylate cyclase (GGDEF)-like protein